MADITKRKNGKWQAKIRRLGWPDNSKIFDTKTDADAWARAVEREMDVGAFIQRDDAERTTFAMAAARYAKKVTPPKASQVQDISPLRLLSEKFAKYSLATISPALAQFAAQLKQLIAFGCIQGCRRADRHWQHTVSAFGRSHLAQYAGFVVAKFTRQLAGPAPSGYQIDYLLAKLRWVGRFGMGDLGLLVSLR
jgi:hypothetical protein